MEEFFRQGDRERALGLEAVPCSTERSLTCRPHSSAYRVHRLGLPQPALRARARPDHRAPAREPRRIHRAGRAKLRRPSAPRPRRSRPGAGPARAKFEEKLGDPRADLETVAAAEVAATHAAAVLAAKEVGDEGGCRRRNAAAAPTCALSPLGAPLPRLAAAASEGLLMGPSPPGAELHFRDRHAHPRVRSTSAQLPHTAHRYYAPGGAAREDNAARRPLCDGGVAPPHLRGLRSVDGYV